MSEVVYFAALVLVGLGGYFAGRGDGGRVHYWSGYQDAMEDMKDRIVIVDEENNQ